MYSNKKLNEIKYSLLLKKNVLALNQFNFQNF